MALPHHMIVCYKFTIANKMIILKNDKYRKARGGEAHLLNIYCVPCNTLLIKYQKDGKGNLLRCYLNRIMHPPHLEKLQRQFTVTNLRDLPNLTCQSCNVVIGTPIVYMDGRIAYKLRKGYYHKKRIF